MTDEPAERGVFAHRLQGRPSLTAEAVCFARALEQTKPAPDRVIDDPYARHFLSAPSRRALDAWSGSFTARIVRRLGRSGTTWVPLRHRFIDEHLIRSLDSGVEQVVLLGAGYDARAYRFVDVLAGRRVFEVDLPAIGEAKARTIAAHVDEFPDAAVVRVPIDFEAQTVRDTLVAAGFVEGAPTLFTWEGVPMYLTRAAVKATLDSVWDAAGPGSAIAFDMWHLVDDPGPLGTARRAAPAALSFIGEPVTFAVHPEEVDHFLRQRGFAVTDLRLAGDLAADDDQRAIVDPSMYVLAAERLDDRPG